MLKRVLISLIGLLWLALPAAAQTGFISGTAFGVNPFGAGGSGPTPVFLAYAPVRVCTMPTSGSPCSTPATITDQFGNPLSISGGNFGQFNTNVVGQYVFGCTMGQSYQIQVAPAGSNTPAQTVLATCGGSSGGAASSVSRSVTNDTITGTMLNQLVCLTAAANAIVCPTTAGANSAIIGVCAAGCGITGLATTLIMGQAPVQLDGAATTSDFVIGSTITAGYGHDAGSTFPSGTEVLGQVVNSSLCVSNLCPVYFMSPNTVGGAGSGGTATAFGTSSNPVSATAATQFGQRYINQATSPNNFALASGLGYELADWGPVFDDATDNCTAITNWKTAVNAYAGAGVPVASITQGVGDKALLTSCGALFTIPVRVVGNGVIDAKSTFSGVVIDLGPTGLGTFSAAHTPPSSVKGLTFIGGAGGAVAIQCEPYISECDISDNYFLNFGTSASTSWAFVAASPNNEIGLINNWCWIYDSTTGRNCFNTYDSSGLGSNTALVVGNHILNATPPSFTGTCGGTGVYLGGSHSKVLGNTFYGFGKNMLLSNHGGVANVGALIQDNAFDTAGCSVGGVDSNIQLGDASTTADMSRVTIIGNDIESGTLFDFASNTGTVHLNLFDVHDNLKLEGTEQITTAALSSGSNSASIHSNFGWGGLPALITTGNPGASVNGVVLDLAGDSAANQSSFNINFFGDAGGAHGQVRTAVFGNIFGTNDVLVQAAPATTAGYGAVEGTNAAGLILSTNTTAPVFIYPNRTLLAQFTTYSQFNGMVASGNKFFVTSDFTDASSGSLQLITGLTSPTLPNSTKWSFHCSLMYSQGTPVSGDQFGVGVLTTAPTNLSATGEVFTNTGAASPVTTSVLTGLTTTTPTGVVTFTPVPTTVLRADLDGTVETGAGASTFNVYVLNGTAADVIVVKRGSYCMLF